MSVRRVVPNIQSEAAEESREFYGLLGFEEVMNRGWIMMLVSPSAQAAQVSFMAGDKTAPLTPDMSMEVDDVDAAYAAMQESGAGGDRLSRLLSSAVRRRIDGQD